MLKRVNAVAFHRGTIAGRTNPAFVTCEYEGDHFEAVAKFAVTCEEGTTNLAREVISACLAADLRLPVPEAMLVEASPEWIETLPEDRRQLMRGSCPVAFGSAAIVGQFAAWSAGNIVSDNMSYGALAVFVFDAVIQNPDRRLGNPNCIVRGDDFRIFDHELAFAHRLMLNWRPPWEADGLDWIARNRDHIFYGQLAGRDLDYEPIRQAWDRLSDAMIDDYRAALPAEWQDAIPTADAAIELIRASRDKIDAVLTEVRRVLV